MAKGIIDDTCFISNYLRLRLVSSLSNLLADECANSCHYVQLFSFLDLNRGIDVNKRTVATHSYNLGIRFEVYKQLSIFFLFYWSHRGLN